MKFPSQLFDGPTPRPEKPPLFKDDDEILEHAGSVGVAAFRTIGRKPTESAWTAISHFLIDLYTIEAFTDHAACSRADTALKDFLIDIHHPALFKTANDPTIPFISFIDDISISKACLCAHRFLPVIGRILFENMLRLSHQTLETINPAKFNYPNKSDLPPIQKVKEYLGGSPFEKLFLLPVPFSIPDERMLEHCAVIAGSGHGKTQLLQSIILNYLQQPDPPALIVIDSTGAMVQRIQRLAIFNDRLADRLLIIDPELDPPPALNMFDMTNERMKAYTGLVREEVESELIELFNYVFASIAREMTGRQSTAFSYIVRLMLSIPTANVHTLRILLSDDAKGYEQSKFRAEVEKLDDVAIEFFRTFFYSTGFRATRTQVLERLLGLLRVPVFNRMFSSRNKLDMYDAMQKGQIVLVNTSARLLKEQASALFGRYIISRTLAGAFERAAIPERQRKPAFLIVDEAAPYFDATFETLLTRVRQFKLGVTVAFQHLEQLDDKLRSAIASNTSVKYAGGLGYTDSRFLARDMETTPEFLKAQRKSDKQTQFACYVRSFTDTAVSLTVPFGLLESQPRMTAEQHAALLQRNCERVTHTEPVAPVATSPVIDELAKDLMKVYTDQVTRNSDTSVSKPGAKTQSEPWESGTTW